MKPNGGATLASIGSQPYVLFAAIAAGLLASAAVLWFATGDVLVVLAYSAGLIVILGAALAFERTSQPAEPDTLTVPDWSVTLAAIEHFPDEALAITDRANRLTCANSTYVDWFGVEAAPPNLALARRSL